MACGFLYEIQIDLGEGWETRESRQDLQGIMTCWADYTQPPRGNYGAARLVLVLMENTQQTTSEGTSP